MKQFIYNETSLIWQLNQSKIFQQGCYKHSLKNNNTIIIISIAFLSHTGTVPGKFTSVDKPGYFIFPNFRLIYYRQFVKNDCRTTVVHLLNRPARL